MNNTTNNNTTNNTTNNNQYNITINPFGKESYECITLDTLVELINTSQPTLQCIPKIAKLVFSQPENKNIVVRNRNHTDWKTIHTNGVEQMIPKKDVIGSVLTNIADYLSEFMDELSDLISGRKYKCLERFIDYVSDEFSIDYRVNKKFAYFFPAMMTSMGESIITGIREQTE